MMSGPPPLVVRPSSYGWTLYDPVEAHGNDIVASADSPGRLVDYAVQRLRSDVIVTLRTEEEDA